MIWKNTNDGIISIKLTLLRYFNVDTINVIGQVRLLMNRRGTGCYRRRLFVINFIFSWSRQRNHSTMPDNFNCLTESMQVLIQLIILSYRHSLQSHWINFQSGLLLLKPWITERNQVSDDGSLSTFNHLEILMFVKTILQWNGKTCSLNLE